MTNFISKLIPVEISNSSPFSLSLLESQPPTTVLPVLKNISAATNVWLLAQLINIKLLILMELKAVDIVLPIMVMLSVVRGKGVLALLIKF